MSVEELVKALRGWKTHVGKTWPFAREAADKLEDLAAENERLKNTMLQNSIEWAVRMDDAVSAAERQAGARVKVKPVAMQYCFEPSLTWHTVDFEDQVPSKKEFPKLQVRKLYTRPHDSRLREALRAVSYLLTKDSLADAEKLKDIKAITRAALAQGSDDGSS